MSRRIAILLALLTPALTAREVRVVWDAAPAGENVKGWRIWRGIEILGTATTPAATVVANTGDSLTVSAFNESAESLQSAPVIVPPIMIWIQKSTDLVTWQNVVQVPYEERRQFIRLQLPPP